MLTIVSRQSKLALWQAEFVKNKLKALAPNLDIKIIGVTTQGDKLLDQSLATIGGKGLFVKELEEYLLTNKADIAVHSMKDVPYYLPDGLCIGAILKREDPRDVLVTTQENILSSLPLGAVIGTSSLRRNSQILALRKDLKIKPLRGNINTRLDKLYSGEYSAIILAAAGMLRLGLEQQISEYFATDNFLPAIGQGALGIECRINDSNTNNLIKDLNCDKTNQCVSTERIMNNKLGGSCTSPVAGYATINKNKLTLQGLVGDLDGNILQASANVELSKIGTLGVTVAEQLLKQGAGEIISKLN